MSKFEELGNLLEKSRSDYLDDIYRCSKFASELVRGLMEYLEIPESEQLVKFFQDKKEDEKTETYRYIRDTMEFNPEDKFWHFGIELKIYEPHNKLNSTRIRWGMLIKSFEDYFILKTDVTAREDIIHENNVEEYNKFYEHIFKQLKTHFEETNINYAKKEDGNNLIYIH